MNDFFGTLEVELRAAAERRPRRTLPVSAVAVAVLLAVALTPIVFVLARGDEEANAPRQNSAGEVRIPGFPGATVVATGTSSVGGRWEMFTYRSERLADPESGEVYQPAGLRCLGLRVLVPGGGLGGQCGEFPRTPGFSRLQHTVRDRAGDPREILVYGRVPEDAALVRVTLAGREAVEIKPIEGPADERGDFYLVGVAPHDRGRVNWIDAEGNEGSVGQELLPP